MTCDRCGGLVVEERFCGGETMLGAWTYHGVRCINCGAIGARGPSGDRAHTDPADVLPPREEAASPLARPDFTGPRSRGRA